jgi:hypothetical protein
VGVICRICPVCGRPVGQPVDPGRQALTAKLPRLGPARRSGGWRSRAAPGPGGWPDGPAAAAGRCRRQWLPRRPWAPGPDRQSRLPRWSARGQLGGRPRPAAHKWGQARSAKFFTPPRTGTLASPSRSRTLRASRWATSWADDDDRTSRADQPQQLLLQIGGAWRQVHQQLVQLAPGDSGQQLVSPLGQGEGQVQADGGLADTTLPLATVTTRTTEPPTVGKDLSSLDATGLVSPGREPLTAMCPL